MHKALLTAALLALAAGAHAAVELTNIANATNPSYKSSLNAA